jgi:hypothetical protein
MNTEFNETEEYIRAKMAIKEILETPEQETVKNEISSYF